LRNSCASAPLGLAQLRDEICAADEAAENVLAKLELDLLDVFLASVFIVEDGDDVGGEAEVHLVENLNLNVFQEVQVLLGFNVEFTEFLKGKGRHRVGS
jgi:hypothetical protein